MKSTHILLLIGALTAGVRLLAQDAAAGSTNNAALDQEARELKPRDTLKFNILEDPSAGRGSFPPIQITEFGDAQFPISISSQEYVAIKAAGRKLADLRKELKEKLDADYYKNATVSLDLVTFDRLPKVDLNNPNPAKVVVLGSINHTVPLREGQKLMLSDLFSQIAGNNPSANLKKVEVMRVNPDTKKTDILKRDVKKMLEQGDLKDDIELKDGDRIRVPEKLINI